jgi:hypothetical protein
MVVDSVCGTTTTGLYNNDRSFRILFATCVTRKVTFTFLSTQQMRLKGYLSPSNDSFTLSLNFLASTSSK